MIDTSTLNTGCIGCKVKVTVKRRSALGSIAGLSTAVYRLVDWNSQGVCVLDDSVITGERWIEKKLVDQFDPLPKTEQLGQKKGFWR